MHKTYYKLGTYVVRGRHRFICSCTNIDQVLICVRLYSGHQKCKVETVPDLKFTHLEGKLAGKEAIKMLSGKPSSEVVCRSTAECGLRF